jgi:hypothetical protein
MRARRFGRVAAATLQLLICLAIAAAVAAVLWGVWYPNGLTVVAGATELLLIIVGANVVLGPLLTLILYIPGKKGLYFDLTVIALLQIAALAYGAYVMLQTRPVFLVALTDRIQLVSANELNEAELAKASRPEYARLSWSGPIAVGSRDPADSDRYMALTASIVSGGPEIDRRPEFYIPFAPAMRSLIGRAKRLSAWKQSNDAAAISALQWVADRELSADDISVVSISGRSGTAAMLIHSATGERLRVFAFDPGVVQPPDPSDIP